MSRSSAWRVTWRRPFWPGWRALAMLPSAWADLVLWAVFLYADLYVFESVTGPLERRPPQTERIYQLVARGRLLGVTLGYDRVIARRRAK